MERRKLSFPKAVWAVLTKDALCELRTPYAFSTLVMFALVTLSSVSMTMGGFSLAPELASALLWVILFFCSMAGLSRVFVQEQETGTIVGLRLYVPGQAVIFGKLLFNLAMLGVLTILIIPLFIVFLNVDISLGISFGLILFFGNTGIAAAATLTAALVAETRGKSALFTVVTFPVLLPQFLAATGATAKALQQIEPGWKELAFLFGYDVVVIIAVSILFDYLWYD